MLFLTFNIQPVKAGGTVYVRADGTVEGTDKIQCDGNVYTFIDDIFDEIVVERSNIIVDGNGYALQGSGTGFQLDGVDNVTIQNVNIQGFATAININDSSYNVISGNTMQDCGGFMGSVILESPYSNYNNTFSRNTFSNNSGSCLVLWGFNDMISDNIITNNNANGINLERDYNTFSGNTISNNTGAGISVSGSSNLVFGNTLENNRYGVWISAPGNTVFQNNFIDNINQTVVDGSNTWDNGAEGNYWSDYLTKYPDAAEVGTSGIGDTPYVIDENNQDNYPLMAQVDISVIPEVSSWAPIVCMFALAVAIAIYNRRASKN